MNLEELKVIITANDRELRKSLDGIKKKLGDLDKNTSKSTNNMSKSLNKVSKDAKATGNSFASLGKVIGGAFAVAGLTSFVKKCAELSSNLEEVQNVVNLAFPNMTKQVNDFTKNSITQFGLSETTAKKMVGTFGLMSKNFGFTEKEALSMGEALTSLAGDVSSLYNISSDEAYTKLKSIYTGETKLLVA